MTTFTLWLGIAGLLVAVISYIPYFRDIFRRKTKPHPFSWLVWGMVSSIAFFAQVVSGAGIGAWTTGITAIACLAIALIAIYLGERRISGLDIVCFIGAITGMVLWQLTDNPLNAVVVVLIVHVLGFIPTVKKAYTFPQEETVSSYGLSLLKWGLGFLALTSFNLTTMLFPVGVFLMNLSFIVLLLVRRSQSK
jgi:hypothetical protein